MEESLSINGKVFISTKEAARITNYTRDYVGQLAREGRIDSKKIGRVRFINRDQLFEYSNIQGTQTISKKTSQKTDTSSTAVSQKNNKTPEKKENAKIVEKETNTPESEKENQKNVPTNVATLAVPRENENTEERLETKTPDTSGSSQAPTKVTPSPYASKSNSLSRKAVALAVALMAVLGPYALAQSGVVNAGAIHVRSGVLYAFEATEDVVHSSWKRLNEDGLALTTDNLFDGISHSVEGSISEAHLVLKDSVDTVSTAGKSLAAVNASDILESVAKSVYRTVYTIFSPRYATQQLAEEDNSLTNTPTVSRELFVAQREELVTSDPVVPERTVVIETAPRVVERIIERTSPVAVTRSELNLRISNVAEDIRAREARLESLISKVDQGVVEVNYITDRQDENVREDIYESIRESVTTETLAVAGDSTFDINTLVVDSTNNRVGIGTATPTALFDVAGLFTVSSDGGVSIGSVAGGVNLEGDLSVAGSATTTGSITSFSSLTAPYLHATSTTATSTFAGGVNINSGAFLYDYSSGNFGIGTEDPVSKFVITNNNLASNPGETLVVDSITSDSSSAVVHFKDSSNDSLFYLRGDGQIGIGTTDTDGYALNIDSGPLRVGGDRIFFSEERGFVYDDGLNDIGIVMDGSSDLANSSFYFDNLGYFGIGTTSPSAALSVVGDALFDGDITIMGNSLTLGESQADTLVVNAYVGSSFVPNSNATYDLGSPSFYWDDVYVDTLTANNISAASTTIAGTASETLTINSDNSSMDAEDAILIFYRGTVTPNALLRWDSTADTFDLTQDLLIKDETPTNGSTRLVVEAGEGQSDNLFSVQSDGGGTPYFDIASDGKVGVGTTTPGELLTLSSTAPALAFMETDQTNSNWKFQANGGDLAIKTIDDIYGTPSTKVTFANSGNVGIGTTGPGAKLEIVGATRFSNPAGIALQIQRGDATANYHSIRTDSASGLIFDTSGSSSNYQFHVNATERLRIDNQGNVGIGTTTPDSILNLIDADPVLLIKDTETSSASSNITLRLAESGISGVTNNYFDLNVGGLGVLSFIDNFADGGTGTRMVIDSTGNVGIGTTSPGAQLSLYKNNENTATPSLALEQAGIGDAFLKFIQTGAREWVLGSDNSDADKFKIATNATAGTGVGTGTLLTIQSDGNVGIGTTSPGYPLDVNGDVRIGEAGSTNALFVDATNGKVGIGTNSPADTLTILPTSAGVGLTIRESDDENDAVSLQGNEGNGNVVLYGGGGSARVVLRGAGDSFFNPSSGNFGIGTTTPNNKLSLFSSDTGVSDEIGISLGVLSNDSEERARARIYALKNGTNLGQLRFQTLGSGGLTDAMTILSDGKIGVGISDPSYKFQVKSEYADGGADTLFDVANIFGSNTSVAQSSGTGVGISFSMAENSGAENKLAGIYARDEGNISTGGLSFHTANSGTLAEKMRLDKNGNLGIGVTSPEAKLHVDAGSATFTYSNAPRIQVTGASAAGQTVLTLATYNNSDAVAPQLAFASSFQGTPFELARIDAIDKDTASNYGGLQFLTNAGAGASARMTIDKDGNVGIGTTSPGYPLDVNGDVRIGEAGSTNALFVDATNGKVGIGTNSPADTLTILPTSAGVGLTIRESDDENDAVSLQGNEGNGNVVLYGGGGSARVVLRGAGDSFFNPSSGNFGIGTVDPAASLDVYRGTSGGGAYGDSVAILKAGYTNAAAYLSIDSNRINSSLTASGGVQFFAPVAGGGSHLPAASFNFKSTTNGAASNYNKGELLFGVSDGTATNQYGNLVGIIVDEVGKIGLGAATSNQHGYWGQSWRPNAWVEIAGDGTTDYLHVTTSDSTPNEGTHGNVFVIDSSGSVGVGTTNPDEGKIEIKGGTVCVDTDSDDTAGSCIASESDERLKRNVQTLSSALDTIRSLRGVSFEWRYDDAGILSHYPALARFAQQPASLGFIAQEVQQVIPEAIMIERVGDDEVQYLQLDYSKITPVLVEALKELDTELESIWLGQEELDQLVTSQISTLKPEEGSLGFFSRILLALGAWIEDGVTKFERLYAYEFDAEEVRAARITASERLCVGETCVTEEELQELLNNQNISNSYTGGSQSDETVSTEGGGDDTPDTADSGESEGDMTASSTPDGVSGDTSTSTEDGSDPEVSDEETTETEEVIEDSEEVSGTEEEIESEDEIVEEDEDPDSSSEEPTETPEQIES